MVLQRDGAGPGLNDNERWELRAVTGHHGWVSLRGLNRDRYFTVSDSGSVSCSATSVGDWERFQLLSLGNSTYHLRSHHGTYLELTSQRTSAVSSTSQADAWVLTILDGPPAAPPTAPMPPCSYSFSYSSVAAGNSCGSRVDWVINNRAMTRAQAEAQVASEYPSICTCDPYPPPAPQSPPLPGYLTATSVALRNVYNGTYLSCTSSNDGSGLDVFDSSAMFEVADAGSGRVSLRNLNQDKYFGATASGGVQCGASNVQGWERFEINALGTGEFSIYSPDHNTYLSVNAQGSLRTVGSVTGTTERWQILLLSPPSSPPALAYPPPPAPPPEPPALPSPLAPPSPTLLYTHNDRRGLTLLLLHPNNYELIEQRYFDTYSSSGRTYVNGGPESTCSGSSNFRCSDALVTYLQGLSANYTGYYVLLAGAHWSHWSNALNSNAFDALRQHLGATVSTMNVWTNGPNYALISRVGGERALAEALSVDSWRCNRTMVLRALHLTNAAAHAAASTASARSAAVAGAAQPTASATGTAVAPSPPSPPLPPSPPHPPPSPPPPPARRRHHLRGRPTAASTTILPPPPPTASMVAAEPPAAPPPQLDRPIDDDDSTPSSARVRRPRAAC